MQARVHINTQKHYKKAAQQFNTVSALSHQAVVLPIETSCRLYCLSRVTLSVPERQGVSHSRTAAFCSECVQEKEARPGSHTWAAPDYICHSCQCELWNSGMETPFSITMKTIYNRKLFFQPKGLSGTKQKPLAAVSISAKREAENYICERTFDFVCVCVSLPRKRRDVNHSLSLHVYICVCGRRKCYVCQGCRPAASAAVIKATKVTQQKRCKVKSTHHRTVKL